VKTRTITYNEAKFIEDFVQAIRPVLARNECMGLLRKSKEIERIIYIAGAKARMLPENFQKKAGPDNG
jgi:hypothetical protein